jgi:hypothetical protein
MKKVFYLGILLLSANLLLAQVFLLTPRCAPESEFCCTLSVNDAICRDVIRPV